MPLAYVYELVSLTANRRASGGALSLCDHRRKGEEVRHLSNWNVQTPRGHKELCPTPARTRMGRRGTRAHVHVLRDDRWHSLEARGSSNRRARARAGLGVRRDAAALTRAHRCAASPVRELMLCNASLITLPLVRRVHQWPEASFAARRGAARRH